MMSFRGICVTPHGGAQKNANAFVLTEGNTSRWDYKGLREYSPNNFLVKEYSKGRLADEYRVALTVL